MVDGGGKQLEPNGLVSSPQVVPEPRVVPSPRSTNHPEQLQQQPPEQQQQQPPPEEETKQQEDPVVVNPEETADSLAFGIEEEDDADKEEDPVNPMHGLFVSRLFIYRY